MCNVVKVEMSETELMVLQGAARKPIRKNWMLYDHSDLKAGPCFVLQNIATSESGVIASIDGLDGKWYYGIERKMESDEFYRKKLEIYASLADDDFWKQIEVFRLLTTNYKTV